jgi:hypothetical protein
MGLGLRAEYGNIVHELLGMAAPAAALLPDDSLRLQRQLAVTALACDIARLLDPECSGLRRHDVRQPEHAKATCPVSFADCVSAARESLHLACAKSSAHWKRFQS